MQLGNYDSYGYDSYDSYGDWWDNAGDYVDETQVDWNIDYGDGTVIDWDNAVAYTDGTDGTVIDWDNAVAYAAPNVDWDNAEAYARSLSAEEQLEALTTESMLDAAIKVVNGQPDSLVTGGGKTGGTPSQGSGGGSSGGGSPSGGSKPSTPTTPQKTAAETLAIAKLVAGATEVSKLLALAKRATTINPATGAPYGLPPGYRPSITQGDGTSGLPLNYSGIIGQLALPAMALAAIFILKG